MKDDVIPEKVCFGGGLTLNEAVAYELYPKDQHVPDFYGPMKPVYESAVKKLDAAEKPKV